MAWWLFQNALGATILALCVSAVVRVGNLSPSAKHALWLVVILKFLAPPFPLWPWPLETPAPISGAAAALTAPVGFDADTSATVFKSVVVGIWAAGGLGVALLQANHLRRLRKMMRGGQAAPDWLRGDMNDLADRIGVTAPRVVAVADAKTPLLISGVRPTLLIPEPLLNTIDRAAWQSILAHELVHLKRRDHWIGWIELAAACLWWWNPLFWYAWWQLRENAECACDAWVVRLFPKERREYAGTLISVADSMSWSALSVAAIGISSGGKRSFERRLEMILREAVPHRMSPFAMAAAVVTALVVLPGLAQPSVSAASFEQVPAKAASAQPTTTNAPVKVQDMRVAELQNVQVGAGPRIRTEHNDDNQPSTKGNAESDGKDSVAGSQKTNATADTKRVGSKQGEVKQKSNVKPSVNKSIKKESKNEAAVDKSSINAVETARGNASATQNEAPAATSEPTAGVLRTSADEKPAAAAKPGSKGSLLVPDEPATSPGGLKNVEIHGEIRVRYDKYFAH